MGSSYMLEVKELIYVKDVDLSFLHYGITIKNSFVDKFTSFLEKNLERGDKVIIKIFFENKEYEAVFTNVAIDTNKNPRRIPAFQIKYGINSDIAKAFRITYRKSNEFFLKNKNVKPKVKLCDEEKEFVYIFSTNKANTFIFAVDNQYEAKIKKIINQNKDDARMARKNTTYVKYDLEGLKNKYPVFSEMNDPQLFTLFCIRYCIYVEDTVPFDGEYLLDYLVDGANDGGIDAIINNPNSSDNEVIIIQSKFYNNTKLTKDIIYGELCKIKCTLSDLGNNIVENYNKKLISAYNNVMDEKEDSAGIKVYLFTAYIPKTKSEREKLEKAASRTVSNLDCEIIFGDIIFNEYERFECGKITVDKDVLTLDRENNFLQYEESVIVNISAKSLQNLQNRKQNSLLGMNLRYFVKQKVVDDGIDNTIKNDSDNFWYKNNGIVIACTDYEIKGNKLVLYNFSIINGGQTTNRIGNLNISKDFFLQCKVVKVKGADEKEQMDFANDIAEATNAQKAIRKNDLKANTPEQQRLWKKLHSVHVYYSTKKGDKAPTGYDKNIEVATLDKVGKLCLAGCLQMPGSSRSNASKMFDEENYNIIFGDKAEPQVIKDLMIINYYYEMYKKEIKKANSEYSLQLAEVNQIAANSSRTILAIIAYVSKVKNGVINEELLRNNENNIDRFREILKKTEGFCHVLSKDLNTNDIKEKMYNVFRLLNGYVVYQAFANFKRNNNRSTSVSDFLKLDNNYYEYTLKNLWLDLDMNDILKRSLDSIL